mmetsp:Transcript_27737/g.61082  ORF Transcript_27737/g.61082 Transcript_27737/m.61082 type:complete len:363 (+) Transcript_27737:60-1148(+)
MQLLHDRRSACLLFQYTCGVLWSSSSFSSSIVSPEMLTLPAQEQQQAVPPALVAPQPTSPKVGKLSTMTLSVKELAAFLVSNTPQEFRRAIRQSGGRFLYRGDENSNENDRQDPGDGDPGRIIRIGIYSPYPDLMLPETYGYDSKALDYFERLEDRLSSFQRRRRPTVTTTRTETQIPKFPTGFSPFATYHRQPRRRLVAKPSNGHIATSDPLEAGRWGRVVSVWPLVTELDNDTNYFYYYHQQQDATPKNRDNNNSNFSYVWPRNRPTFYSAMTTAEDNEDTESNINNYNPPQQKQKRRETDDILVINEQLEDALLAKDGREVLFATNTNANTMPSSTFVAVSIEIDNELKHELEAIDYGL